METIYTVRNHFSGETIDRFPSAADASTYAVAMNQIEGRRVYSVRPLNK